MTTPTAASLVTRRSFLGTTAAAMIAPTIRAQEGSPAQRRIKIGLIGAGGRGTWIAKLFKEHGGYEFHSVADYFPEVAEKTGAAIGVDKSRCFSGLKA